MNFNPFSKTEYEEQLQYFNNILNPEETREFFYEDHYKSVSKELKKFKKRVSISQEINQTHKEIINNLSLWEFNWYARSRIKIIASLKMTPLTSNIKEEKYIVKVRREKLNYLRQQISFLIFDQC